MVTNVRASDMKHMAPPRSRDINFEGRHMKVVLLPLGHGEYCLRLANALIQKTEVLLLLAPQRLTSDLSTLDPAVNFQPFNKPRLRQPVQQIRMIYTLLQHIKNFDPDVIHLQAGHFWFNFALPLLRRYPLVLTIHDPRHHVGDRLSQKTPQTILDFGYRRADQVIVHAKQLKQEVVQRLGIPGQNVHVIPHIAPSDDAVQNQVHEDNHLILFFGRIWEYKGLEYLIRAEPLITAQVPNARIVIAGQGEDFARYRRMMIHPESFIVYNEYIPYEKRAELFRRASVVVLPYIEASQSGIIPIAYTFEKPVVATTVGGLPEMVEHGRTGYLVPPRDERALADAIVRLLRDKTLRHQLGVNGKRKIDTEFSADSVAKKTLAVYLYAINCAKTSNSKYESP